MFHPIPPEILIEPLIQQALRNNIIVALPRFDPATLSYAPAIITNLSADLRPGPFNIPEPTPQTPPCHWNRLDLALVPGLGFSSDGKRLGRGKGFYDRLLASFRGTSIGLALDFQVLDDLPAEPHDMRLDNILTPTRWIICKPRAGADSCCLRC